MLQLAQSIFPEAIPEVEEKPMIIKGRKKTVTQAASASRPKVQDAWKHIHAKFRENTYSFVVSKIVKAMAEQRLARGLPPGEDASEGDNYDLDASDRK